ncbi:hypothetical protein D3Z51_13750 [Clostridiaceae bacterium]|nr:hypothetical protein [Clostridiaceae bacterium]RKI11872.1 hypothetical protein D7V81_13180 [bacterium 1XD21-70]
MYRQDPFDQRDFRDGISFFIAESPKIVFVIWQKPRKRKGFRFYIDKIMKEKYNQIHNKTI